MKSKKQFPGIYYTKLLRDLSKDNKATICLLLALRKANPKEFPKNIRRDIEFFINFYRWRPYCTPVNTEHIRHPKLLYAYLRKVQVASAIKEATEYRKTLLPYYNSIQGQPSFLAVCTAYEWYNFVRRYTKLPYAKLPTCTPDNLPTNLQRYLVHI